MAELLPEHSEEDHPVLTVPGVVNKCLQLKNNSIFVYTISEETLVFLIVVSMAYWLRGSREACLQES